MPLLKKYSCTYHNAKARTVGRPGPDNGNGHHIQCNLGAADVEGGASRPSVWAEATCKRNVSTAEATSQPSFHCSIDSEPLDAGVVPIFTP